MAEFLPDLPAIKDYLQTKGEEPLVTQTGIMLRVDLRNSTRVSRLDIRQPYPRVLHFTTPLPLDFPVERLGEVALLIAKLNRKLLVPGFVIQPKPPCGVIFLTTAFLNHDGSISSEVVDRAIQTCHNTVDQFLETIEAVAEGRDPAPTPDATEPPKDPA